jgi:hypothetical protein
MTLNDVIFASVSWMDIVNLKSQEPRIVSLA